ncbi:MAG: M20/M25/M40 family metallo-hydrolase [Anaerolineales bacterium]|nr:M20/M25/M40 family metallo-hydrolase [Anaerolineales bacterium]MCS7247759.1 M20/M25/M40 family metallo-hydrolase [Anaerolineales bacterium]MDW8161569.1 M20/M25/M40 family metallo-hydrolase [Anaerolineales bacterium]MDW8448175.1 M20/M25/M40 family metallo-hydrolase [Anaerolineales bacterium]
MKWDLPAHLLERILDLAIQIQCIPAPTFQEQQRAQFVLERFREEKLDAVFSDAVGNVYALRQGQTQGVPLVVSAHLDTVFPAELNKAAIRKEDYIHGPGIGDNALGVAALFGVLWALEEYPFSQESDLWLIATVCEEGLGDLRGMRAVVERFRGRVRAYLVLEGMALGQVYHRALGVRRYRLKVETAGGHSWVDFGTPSAIHHLAKLIVALDALPLPRSPRTTLNVGVISGGISVNTIAASATAELDLRSEDAASLAQLERQVSQLIHQSQRDGVKVSAERIGDRPAGAISERHPLVQLAVEALKRGGIQPVLNVASTDANIPLSYGYPAIGIGLTYGEKAHTLHEMIHASPLRQGMRQLMELVEKLTQ